MKKLILLLALATVAPVALAGTSWLKIANQAAREVGDQTTTVQHHGAVEVGFAPHEGAE